MWNKGFFGLANKKVVLLIFYFFPTQSTGDMNWPNLPIDSLMGSARYRGVHQSEENKGMSGVIRHESIIVSSLNQSFLHLGKSWDFDEGMEREMYGA